MSLQCFNFCHDNVETKGPLSRSRQNFSYRDKESSRLKVLCCDRVFLCRDRVGQARSFLSQRNILSRDRVWPNGEVLCCDREILCHGKVGQGKEKLCRDKAILCCDRVGQGKENLCRGRGFLDRDRTSHDTSALSPTTELGVHDKVACETGEFCHNREFFFTTDIGQALRFPCRDLTF